MNSKITFLRHGETEENERGVFCGSSDPRLVDAGRRQACRAGVRLSGILFDVLLYGNARRVEETAKLALEHMTPQPQCVLRSEHIREMDFGAFEGLHNTQIERRFPQEWHSYLEDWKNFTFPLGDSVIEYYEHCRRFVQWVQREYHGKNVLAVAHKGFILCCLSILSGGDLSDIFSRNIENGEFIVADFG